MRSILFTVTPYCVTLPAKRNQKNQMNSNQISVHSSTPRFPRLSLRGIFMVAVFAVAAFTFAAATAQTRDHLTDPETELVRDNQQLDKRIEVFIKAIDRRFAIVTGAPQ